MSDKDLIDQALCRFANSFLKDASSGEMQHRIARTLWLVATTPLEAHERAGEDLGWPYHRLRYWIEGRTAGASFAPRYRRGLTRLLIRYGWTRGFLDKWRCETLRPLWNIF